MNKDMMPEKYYLMPGYIFVSEKPFLIQTVLGSCVSVCIWDAVNHFGGMNHYIFSKPFRNEMNGKFGTVSIQHMLKLVYSMGSSTKDLRAHILGGGHKKFSDPSIGENNWKVAEEILGREGVTILTRDTGGETGRKVIFNNRSGEILVYKGIDVRKDDWYDRT